MKKCRLVVGAGALILTNAWAQPRIDAGPHDIVIHRTKPSQGGAPTAGSTGPQTPAITYHGGPVMATPSVYLIWYGNWNQSNGSDNAAGQAIVNDFLYGMGGASSTTPSTYYDINTSYGLSITGTFTVGGQTTDNYSQGSRLSDSKVQAVVANAINNHKLPSDSNGIYFVLTSSDVSENSGFCFFYCGWHTHATIGGTDIKYSFVGNANRCLNGCAAQSKGPNGNAGVDGMVSVIAHELEETNTDPDLNAWYDSKGNEDADKCAWTFGQSLQQVPNGAYYNMTLPGLSVSSRPFLIQRELDANSLCYVNYVTKAQ